MDTGFKSNCNNSNSCISEQEETDVAQENGIDKLVTCTSSPKKRRGIQKRVVQIPIKEIEGCRLKGESNTPPSDSWAWRKYGQKPIKGSPYPRGYYRCSSSKGCPARKQVERSRVDPTMLVVTYSSDHNHPWPASRNNHHKSHSKPEPEVVTGGQDPEPEPEPEPESEEKFADPTEGSLMITTTEDELGWFGEMEGTATTSSVMLESTTLTGDDADVASIFLPMRGEDEWLFADLGELPECSVVFRRGALEREEEGRRCAVSWCGTTGSGG